MPRSPLFAAGALAVCAASTPAAAQLTTAGPTMSAGPRVGVVVGLSSATLSETDSYTTPGGARSFTTKRRNGLVAGLSLALPVGASPFSIRPELLYAQKGARATESIELATPNGEGIVNADASTKLDYLEFPVLVQLDVPTGIGLRPSLYAGPSVAYLVRCRVDLTLSGTQDNQGCEDSGAGLNPRKVDVSGVVGGQLGFDLGGQAVAVGARYTLGFTNVSRELNTKNRALAVYGTVEFPFGR